MAEYDLVVIGSGPGGYVAAIRASQLGMNVACIERAELGGVCLNWGCIPSKALLHTAKLYRELNHGKKWGFTVNGDIEVNWEQVIKRSRKVAGRLNKGVGSLFKKYGVTHVEGEARLDRPGLVVVKGAEGEQKLEAKHIIVATGARARALPGLEFDGDKIMNYRNALVVDEMPERILIVGGGAIGCEFAYFFNSFGSKVTQVEMMDRLLPIEDKEISASLGRSFDKYGIDVRTGAIATDIKLTENGVTATIKKVGSDEGETVEFDKALIAIGIVSNVEGLNLEECGVELNRGVIKVDADLKTTTPGIYSIGDCAGAPALAHKASAEGVHCVERIAGHAGKPIDYGNIPNCTYCEPQVASVGLTEETCKEQGLDYRVGKFPFMASGKSLAIDEKDGFVKVLFDKGTGELLGCHIIGYGATELIAEMTLARSMEATEAEILGTIHAHPTLAEALHEAVGQAFGESVNY